MKMKRYSVEFFEKKYRTLFNKLLIKKGFVEAVKETRQKLGLPERGFPNEAELATFLISKMTRFEQGTLTYFAFYELYAATHGVSLLDESKKDEVFSAYITEYGKDNVKKGAVDPVRTVHYLGGWLQNHHEMLTDKILFRGNAYLKKLSPETLKLIRKFWGLDLLDEHIMGLFVDRYLFLGDYGVDRYIKSKIACSNCRYIGIQHFSPVRTDMEAQEKGPYSKGYILNKEAVKRLSLHFNSVFLIIKPYAAKEEVLKYVEDNWQDLKEHIEEKNTFYRQFDVNPSRIKESNFERNQLIYELYKLPKKELLKMYKGQENLALPGMYKESIISHILRDNHNIEMFPDAVKKAAMRFAKSISVRNKPKDIRDI
jgi:hypothetical protein